MDDIPNMDMNANLIQLARILAEVLRIQRWAGGDTVSADRIFGLMNGFESIIRVESESPSISEATQERVENLLEEVEAGSQSTDGTSIKDRLHRERIREADAEKVMCLCRLQGRFVEGIEMIAGGHGSVFQCLGKHQLLEQDWLGALHYMELVDCTEGTRKKMHAVFAPGIPRVGEFITPHIGSQMRVVAVEYVAISQGESKGVAKPVLVPHIILESKRRKRGRS